MALGGPLRELLRHVGQLGQRLRRRRDAGGREVLLVVIEAVGVGEERHRAALAAVLGVGADRVRELVEVNAVALHVRVQVDPRTRGAELADDVGGVRHGDVGTLTGADRLQHLVVVLAILDDYVHRGTSLEVGDDLRDGLAIGEECKTSMSPVGSTPAAPGVGR
jgi:hypothetical protein